MRILREEEKSTGGNRVSRTHRELSVEVGNLAVLTEQQVLRGAAEPAQ